MSPRALELRRLSALRRPALMEEARKVGLGRPENLTTTELREWTATRLAMRRA